MFNVKSNDPRIEGVMETFWSSAGTTMLSLFESEYFTLQYKGDDGWNIMAVIKRPYTFVSVERDGKVAHSFGKVNWEDDFCQRSGFEIVSRKALAEWHRNNFLIPPLTGNLSSPRYKIGQKLLGIHGGSPVIIESFVINQDGTAFYKFLGWDTYVPEDILNRSYRKFSVNG